MNSRGFSLVEILVVIAIAGILFAIATLDFNSMQQKGQIEKQTREIHSELAALRIDAMQKKQRSAAFLGPKQIVFKRYTSNAENLQTGGIPFATKNLPLEIRKLSQLSTPLDVTSDLIWFDSRGYSSLITLVVLPVILKSGDNCILVSAARTNIGRMEDAATCTAR